MDYAADDFSADRLGKLILLSLQRGYAPVFFGDEEGHAEPFVLWRHDIDLDLDCILAMAEIEAGLGVPSTYFFMTQSRFYNLFSRQGEDVLHRLKELGHRLGLHCVLEAKREQGVETAWVEERVERDFALLEAGHPGLFERVVSFHNPPRAVLRRKFDGFYSTYQQKFFGPIKYLSDSNRIWREGPPEEWFDPGRVPRLSILLHPVIWAYPGSDMPAAMRAYLARSNEKRRLELIEDDVLV